MLSLQRPLSSILGNRHQVSQPEICFPLLDGVLCDLGRGMISGRFIPANTVFD